METLQTILFGCLLFILLFMWIWAVIDIVQRKFKGTFSTIGWLFVVFAFPFLGTIVYFLYTRKK